MKRRMRLAITGCGAISAKHLEAVVANGNTYELVAVCDVAYDRARAFGATAAMKLGAPAPAVYADDGELLKVEQPDVLAIATPSAFHVDAILRALDAGAHVIAEKPLALSTNDLDRIEKAASAANRLVTVCYVTRFAPHIRALSAKLSRGSFGQVRHASLSIYWNRNPAYYEQARWRGTWKMDGGALMNQCTHGLDLLQWVSGSEPTRVHSEIRRLAAPIEAEDFGTAIMSFQSGVTATFVGTVATYPQNLGATMTVLGDRGTVQLGGVGLGDVLAWRFADNAEDEEQRAIAGDFEGVDGRGGHTGVYDDLAAAILDRRPPVVTLSDARRSVELVLAMYKSARLSQAVTFPLSFSTEEMIDYHLTQ